MQHLYAEIGIKTILANWRKHLVHHTVLLSVPGQTCDHWVGVGTLVKNYFLIVNVN